MQRGFVVAERVYTPSSNPLRRLFERRVGGQGGSG
ncbi:hypothetical protein BDI4_320091 [Burkholderia diffusa]|nr:hypothetical protein BDI4_320091 [Burkholderia diffusa]